MCAESVNNLKISARPSDFAVQHEHTLCLCFANEGLDV